MAIELSCHEPFCELGNVTSINEAAFTAPCLMLASIGTGAKKGCFIHCRRNSHHPTRIDAHTQRRYAPCAACCRMISRCARTRFARCTMRC